MPAATDRPTTALYVRIPTPVATALDRMSSSTGRAKQQIVTEIFEGVLATKVGEGGPAVGSNGAAGLDVMTLDQTAALLLVTPDEIVDSVEVDGLPARRIGGEWRFARAAVLDWLAEPRPPSHRGTRTVAGFGAQSSPGAAARRRGGR